MADDIDDGTRVGRFLIIWYVDGTRHACQPVQSPRSAKPTADPYLMLPGGKLVHVPLPLLEMVDRLDGRPRI